MSRFRLLAAGIGAAGLLACAVGLAVDAGAVLRGWLAGFAFWIGLPLGATMLLLAHDLTGGRWGRAARGALEAAAATMPAAVPAILPVLFGLPLLYPWARPEQAAHLPNTFWLNTPFFILRTAAILALWILFAALAVRRRPSAGGGVAAPGLIILGLTATIAAIDWTMSLEPEWSSSIYGMLVISGHLIGALAVAVLATVARRIAGPEERGDLGSMLAAGILLWAYLAFMQFLIIWEEDLPKEIAWYLPRIIGGWGGVAIAVALGQGLLPFLALIWKPIKRSRFGLGAVCCLLLAAHLLECWWLVLPAAPDHGFTGFAPAATLGMGGLWIALFCWRLDGGRLAIGRRAALPEGSPHG